MIHVIACPHYFSPGIFGCFKNYLSKVYCTRDFILRHATFEFNTIENILIHTKRKTTATWAGPIVVCMCVIATIRSEKAMNGIFRPRWHIVFSSGNQANSARLKARWLVFLVWTTLKAQASLQQGFFSQKCSFFYKNRY